jgi:hypothetical protein
VSLLFGSSFVFIVVVLKMVVAVIVPITSVFQLYVSAALRIRNGAL